MEYLYILFCVACILLAENLIHRHFKNKPNMHISFTCVKKLKVKIRVTRKRIFAWIKRKYDLAKQHIFLAFLDYVD